MVTVFEKKTILLNILGYPKIMLFAVGKLPYMLILVYIE